MQFNIAIRVIVGREQDFHHKKKFLYGAASIKPWKTLFLKKDSKGWKKRVLTVFLDQLQDFCSFILPIQCICIGVFPVVCIQICCFPDTKVS